MTQNMKMAKIVQNIIGQIVKYCNIFVYFGQIYSFSKIFVDPIYSDIYLLSFYQAEYIRILICPISMVTSIFGYSFIQKHDICPTLDCNGQ